MSEEASKNVNEVKESTATKDEQVVVVDKNTEMVEMNLEEMEMDAVVAKDATDAADATDATDAEEEAEAEDAIDTVCESDATDSVRSTESEKEEDSKVYEDEFGREYVTVDGVQYYREKDWNVPRMVQLSFSMILLVNILHMISLSCALYCR